VAAVAVVATIAAVTVATGELAGPVLIGAAIGAEVGAGTSAVTQLITTGKIDPHQFFVDADIGGVWVHLVDLQLID